MTKIYTAGEHARIIKADPGFNDELGEKQVGLVGTVTSGTDYGSAYIKFPHYAADLYFLSNEIEPVGGTPAPEPEKEYLFREGDHVRYTGNNQSWKGSEFIVNNDVEKSLYHNAIRLTATKVPEALQRQGYKFGSNVGLASDTIEKFTPVPEKEYLFREGDHVRFLAGHNEDWTGAEFIVREDLAKGSSRHPWYSYDLAQLTVTKPAKTGYSVGAHTQVGAHKLEKFTPEPEPKFLPGDWVKVEGYLGTIWNGTVGKVVEDFGQSVLIKNEEHNEFGLTFPTACLVHTEEPVVHKFKVGDWVKVVNYLGSLNGKVGQVTAQPNEDTRLYRVTSGDRTNLVFLERELEATTEPHWTETAPKHSAARIDGRTVVKLSDDQWLFLYHDGDYNETVKHAVYRTGEEAKNLFYRSQPELTTPH